MINEYFYSNDGDTTYVKSYNNTTGESHIWKSPHLNNRDSTIINKNCIAYISSNKDTLMYKFSYRQNDKDSIIYSYNSSDLDKCNYSFEVYRTGLIVDLGYISHKLIENNILTSKYQIFFNKLGFPYKSCYFDSLTLDTFESEIKVETY
jgi:hypothetical protein